MTDRKRNIGPRQPVAGKPLTRREAQVLGHVANGLSTLEIADQMALRQSTIRTHFRSIYSKLDCHTRTQLVITAIRMGFGNWVQGRAEGSQASRSDHVTNGSGDHGVSHRAPRHGH